MISPDRVDDRSAGKAFAYTALAIGSLMAFGGGLAAITVIMRDKMYEEVSEIRRVSAIENSERKQRVLSMLEVQNPVRRRALDVFLSDSGCDLDGLRYNPSIALTERVAAGEKDPNSRANFTMTIICDAK